MEKTNREPWYMKPTVAEQKKAYDEEFNDIQNIIKDSNARIVTVNTEFFVIEKTGFREDTEKLYKDLAPFGLLQFTRSGRIAVSKEKMGISEILNTFKNLKLKQ